MPRGTRRFTDEQEHEICRRYEAGESSTALIADLSLPSTAMIGRYLKKHGFELRAHPQGSKLTQPEIKEVCRLYSEGTSACALAERFGVTENSIYYQLRNRGIPVRSHYESAFRYFCNDTFFDRIDTEQKAYWLGFIAADGYVSDIKPLLGIRLKESDRDHLELFKQHIGSSKPLYFGIAKSFGGSFGSYALDISSRQLVAGLNAHGIHPRKSLTHEWPDFLQGNTLRHYIRGYFDGDGSFSAKEGKPFSYRASFIGSRYFLEGCRTYLIENCGPSGTQVRLHKRGGKIHVLSYGGRLKVQRFARFLYRDATVYLPRKREIIANLL